MNVGTPVKPAFVPAEFCRILPSPVKIKLNEMDSQAMIEFACRQPGDNYHSIMTRGQDILQHDAALLVRMDPVHTAPLAPLLLGSLLTG